MGRVVGIFMKCLFVDDAVENLKLFEKVFTGKGHEALLAENGKEALAKLRSERVDVIISDILMPVMDGYLLCRNVRADKAFDSIPFIFLSATFVDEKDRFLAEQLGADRFLTKPIRPTALIKEVEAVLAKNRSRKDGSNKIRFSPIDEFVDLYNERIVSKPIKPIIPIKKRECFTLKLHRKSE